MRILTAHHTAEEASHINDHDLIIGCSGCGKTSGYIVPNILQAAKERKESLIITDSKGNLYTALHSVLEQAGYDVALIDIRHLRSSPFSWDPIAEIRTNQDGTYSTQDMSALISAITPSYLSVDKYWDHAVRQVLSVALGYLMSLDHKYHSITNMPVLLSAMSTGAFTAAMQEYALCHDANDTLVTRWNALLPLTQADRTWACVSGMASERLDAFSDDDTVAFFGNENRLQLDSIGNHLSAICINTDDVDRSKDAVTSILMQQITASLIHTADAMPDSRLPVPARLLLDDYSDSTIINQLPELSSVCRSRGLSLSICCQNMHQLVRAHGEHGSATLISNFDHVVYEGGSDPDTAALIARRMNVMTGSVLNLPIGKAILSERGSAPVYDDILAPISMKGDAIYKCSQLPT